MRIALLLAGLMAVPLLLTAREPDKIYHTNIRTVKLHKAGDQASYPAIGLNTGEQLELHFDDMDGDVKFYYYSFVLCNADWTPANIQPFDYVRGFLSNRIGNYRGSSVVQTRYTHYQAQFPERGSAPTRSGNYLLKVFLNDDTSKLAFTRRFLVVNTKAQVIAQVMQPFNSNYFQTHQRVQVGITTQPGQINSLSPQDIKVVVLQNYNWGSASVIDRPTVFRSNYYEYSDENNTVFEAGREWRWIDLRSLRLMSERMEKIVDDDRSARVDVIVQPDQERRLQRYIMYRDLNGLFTVENRDNANPLWQGEYAWVHFRYVPPGNRAYEGKSLYLFGEMTQFRADTASKMIFNEEKGQYEKSLYLKQGYYNYNYVTLTDRRDPGVNPSLENTEGNVWITENSYLVMVYFRPFGARADELIGFARVNSALGQR